MTKPQKHDSREPWRRLGMWLLLFGIIGVAAELMLLEHFEDPWQWAPIALLSVGLLTSVSLSVHPVRAILRVHQVVMFFFLAAGGLGVYFHLKANVEFELELRPSMAGMELVIESLKGAMPALAPGAMAQLGLLGLLVTYRHPVTNRAPHMLKQKLEE